MRQRNIFLTKRQNSMVVSACELNLDWLSSELAKFPQTLQTAKGRNRFEVMFFLSPQIFCSQTETFPGSCLLLAKEPAMESEETSQQATSQLWQNLTKDLYQQAARHYWQPTQTMHGFVFDSQITRNDPYIFARCLIWANIEEHLMIPLQMWIGMMRWKSDRFWSDVMIHGGGGTLKICFTWRDVAIGKSGMISIHVYIYIYTYTHIYICYIYIYIVEFFRACVYIYINLVEFSRAFHVVQFSNVKNSTHFFLVQIQVAHNHG